MKVYYYEAKECGMPSWPSGTLRLEGLEVEKDPLKADLFVSPGALFHFQNPNDIQNRFQYHREFPERHVFFDVSDFYTPYKTKALLIRCNLHRCVHSPGSTCLRHDDMLAPAPNSIPWAWPVEDFGDIAGAPPGGYQHDVSFIGWISHPTRDLSTLSCLGNPRLTNDIKRYNEFYGYIERDRPEDAKVRKLQYKESLRYARLSLCGESINGVFPYRFFEAMSAGRVPVLFCSGHMLPWAKQIPYDDFCFRFESSQANDAGVLCEEIIKKTPDQKLLEMGNLARAYWLEYLNSRDWPKLMTKAVLEKLSELGIGPRV